MKIDADFKHKNCVERAHFSEEVALPKKIYCPDGDPKKKWQHIRLKVNFVTDGKPWVMHFGALCVLYKNCLASG